MNCNLNSLCPARCSLAALPASAGVEPGLLQAESPVGVSAPCSGSRSERSRSALPVSRPWRYGSPLLNCYHHRGSFVSFLIKIFNPEIKKCCIGSEGPRPKTKAQHHCYYQRKIYFFDL
ncbi:hypothetical protein INR49_026728 [Caranx melampygus]|nr:hypothetical protein INR49_026728 [Caranx melampygus]